MIWMINTTDLSLHGFEGRSVPEYAILSHRWESDEISLQELQGNLNPHKAGWEKLRRFCDYARQRGQHDYVWMDTCCIDKTSSAELSEAINSMFKWYRRAKVCYAYLYDVPGRGDLDVDKWTEIFKKSEWFTRGWTLQELLAPRELTFVPSNWSSENEIGCRTSLSRAISQITRIPEQALTNGWSLKDDFGASRFTVAQIMSWASGRHTARIEDTAYSLMGLFCINMSLLYGEGLNAFLRLQLEIMSKYDDNSLFAWEIPPSSHHLRTTAALNLSLDLPRSYTWGGLLAPSIQCFRNCTDISSCLENFADRRLFTMTSRGVQVEGLLTKYTRNRHGDNCWLLPLNCSRDFLALGSRLGVVLSVSGQFAMREVDSEGFDSDLIAWNFDGADITTSEKGKMSSKQEQATRGGGVYERLKVYVPQAWPGDFD